MRELPWTQGSDTTFGPWAPIGSRLEHPRVLRQVQTGPMSLSSTPALAKCPGMKMGFMPGFSSLLPNVEPHTEKQEKHSRARYLYQMFNAVFCSNRRHNLMLDATSHYKCLAFLVNERLCFLFANVIKQRTNWLSKLIKQIHSSEKFIICLVHFIKSIQRKKAPWIKLITNIYFKSQSFLAGYS